MSFTPGRSAVFRRNDDYWDGRPSVDRLVFRPIPEASTRLAELQAGTVDIIVGLNYDAIPLVDADRQWGKAMTGLADTGVPRIHFGVGTAALLYMFARLLRGDGQGFLGVDVQEGIDIAVHLGDAVQVRLGDLHGGDFLGGQHFRQPGSAVSGQFTHVFTPRPEWRGP